MNDGDPNPSAAELRAHPGSGRWAGQVASRLLPERAPSGQPAEPTEPGSTALTIGGVDVGAVLAHGPATRRDAEVVGALLLLGLDGELRGAEVPVALAADLVRLSAEGPFDPLGAIDLVFGSASGAAWRAVARVAEATDGDGASPATASVALAALASSKLPSARSLAAEIGARHRSPVVRRAAAIGLGPSGVAGEFGRGPRSTLATVLLGVSGWLLLSAAARVLARLTLGLRRPAELTVNARGLELNQKTLLLGKVLRERRTLFTRDGVARVTREVRFARAALYAGLIALALGTYVGMGLFLDGVRVPGTSSSLIGLGLLAIALGLALDYGLTSLSDLSRGRCRVLLVPVRGRSFALSGLAPADADALLRRLAVEFSPEAPPPGSLPASDAAGAGAEPSPSPGPRSARAERTAPAEDELASPPPPPAPAEPLLTAENEVPDEDVAAARAASKPAPEGP